MSATEPAAGDAANAGREPVAWLLLTATSLCWSANTIFAKLAVGEASPMVLVALRWLLVLVVLAFIARRSLVTDWPVLRSHLKRIAAMGALGFTAFNILFYVAAHHTSALNLGITQAVMPILIFLIVYLRHGVAMTRLQLIGLLAGALGVLLVVSHGDWARLVATQFNVGDLMVLGAVLLYAAYTVALRSRPAVSPLAFFAVLAASAFATALPFAIYEWAVGDAFWPTATGWVLAVNIALLPSLLGQLMFIRGVEIIGPGRAGMFVNLTPVFAAVSAVAFLGERFYWYHGAALGLVFAGIWAAERGGAGPVFSGVRLLSISRGAWSRCEAATSDHC
ncbi:MAG: DMT family transporter [Gammaproteobacteria bacterium]|nr:DMT family transporter [Gammaproteobacteria bacterium]